MVAEAERQRVNDFEGNMIGNFRLLQMVAEA